MTKSRLEFLRCKKVFWVYIVFTAVHCVAAPFAEWLEGRSPSGAAVTIWAEGDEYSASFEAEDGHAVVFDSKSLTYFYAQQDGDGALVSTGIAVGDETTVDKGVLAAIPFHLRDTSQAAAEERARRIAKAEEEMGMTERWKQLKENARARREFEEKVASGQKTDVLNAPPSSPTLGTIVGVTLLVDFPLTNAYGVVTNTLSKVRHPGVTPEKLNELLNGENCTLYNNASSVRKYYEDVSCGNLSYTNIVLGWFTAAHPREYYDDPEKDNGPSARELIGEVLSQIASDPEYSTKYLPLLRQASYSGSYFRALNVWFAGPKAAVWSQGLWAHKWNLASAQRNLLPVQTSGGTKYFNTYQITPVTSSPTIGTFCHENGHMICGFPDLYDYNYGNGGSAGRYSLMSNSGTTNPIYVDAYLRAAAGWVTPRELPSAPALITVSNRLDCVWRYSNPSDSKQYYLIENRQNKGRDSNIPGGGILIWRCDETGDNEYPERLSGFTGYGYATNRVSSELSLEQADGLYELERRTKSSDANDLWFNGNSAAGYGGMFYAESSPCAKWRDASNAAILLSNFSAKGDVMTFFSGETGEYERPLVVSSLKSKGLSSMTFGVVASTIGKNASRLLVYADIVSASGGASTQRSDYLGDIRNTGVESFFTVSGLLVGAQHTVKLRFVQVGGAGAVVETAPETLFIEADTSIASAVGAPDIPFWHDSEAHRWFPTNGTYHSGPTSVTSGNAGIASSKSILHAGVTGPGQLTFWWKVSSESVSWDWLEVSFDGSSETNKIGGTGGTWSKMSLQIPEGEHVVTWIYRKDGSYDEGEDCGWIDSVVWTPEVEPPETPTGLVATQGTDVDGISLVWNEAALARGYEVWRSVTANRSAATLLDETPDPEYVDTNATPGTTYWYWVRAVNTVGSSGFSGSVSGWRPNPLVVTTTSIPSGRVGAEYSATLSATGGKTPYRWSMPLYIETRESSSSLPAGTAQGFKDDDKCWSLSLPFAFQFYGGLYSTVWINSNGTLTFDGTFSSFSPSLATLQSRVMIAPLWKDLNTSSGDIYVDSSSSEITIRWDGIYYSSTAVSFAVTLYADGTIRMRYGSGNANGGMIGLSDGYGSYILSQSSQSGSMSGAKDIVFRSSGAPAGLSLSEGGVLSGTPSEIGSHQFSVVVEDANGTTATKSLVFVVENSGAFTVTTPVPVPYAWLNSYPGLLSSSGGDYETMANAQSPGANGSGKAWPDGSPCYVWQDYVAGTSPTNDAVFTANIRMDGATPVIEWSPDLNDNGRYSVRNYTIWGKTNLTDHTEWMCPTNSGHRFFKVKVEMP